MRDVYGIDVSADAMRKGLSFTMNLPNILTKSGQIQKGR